MESEILLAIKDLKAGYYLGKNMLDGINLTIKKGQFVGVLGQNGSGKSTLARAICGMMPYHSGSILLNGKPIDSTETQAIINMGVGYFKQGGYVFPNLTIEENLQVSNCTLSKQEFLKRKEELFSEIPFFNKNKMKELAANLSSGERSILALAMILINTKFLLILDEPSAGLSPRNVNQLYKVLFRLKRQKVLSYLLIEQNNNKVIHLCDSIFILQNSKLSRILFNIPGGENE